MVEARDGAGFESYHIAEHHMTRISMAPSPNVYLGAMSQCAKRMKIGAFVHLLPLYDPLRLIARDIEAMGVNYMLFSLC